MVTNITNFDLNRYDFYGESTDTKPTKTPAGATLSINSLFLELDTGKLFYFDGFVWQEVGGQP